MDRKPIFVRRSSLMARLVVLVGLLLLSAQSVPSRAQTSPPSEPDHSAAVVAPAAWVATARGSADLFVTMRGAADLATARLMQPKAAKTRAVFASLTAFTRQAQAPLWRELAARGVSYRSFWINNSLAIGAADRSTLAWLATRPEIARIDLDQPQRGIAPIEGSTRPVVPATPDEVAWGVARIQAPEVWALGYRGQGIVVADLDTGVQWDHPALKPQYRGWNGTTATHAYSWFDPTNKTPLTPSDDNGHGTHTTGTMIGFDGGPNQVGVAPDARWIGCRNMDSGYGSVALYTACLQFALAPTDASGNNPNPDVAADITNNSWGCDPSAGEAGCEVPTAFVSAAQSLRDAGIMVVASAGNSGSGCSTVETALATLDQAFTIGATTSSNTIASYSSRGPSTLNGYLKPDLVAPGDDVVSTTIGNGYGSKSGTSMAAPHVAGVTALVWSAVPRLRGAINETEAILRMTAAPRTSNQSCGGLSTTAVPNHVYGYGLINALAAVNQARQGLILVGPAQARVDQAASFSLTVTNYSPVTRNNAVLQITLPATTTLISSLPAGSLNGQTLTWNLGNLAAGSITKVNFSLSANQPGRLVLANYTLTFSDVTAPLGGNPWQTLITLAPTPSPSAEPSRTATASPTAFSSPTASMITATPSIDPSATAQPSATNQPTTTSFPLPTPTRDSSATPRPIASATATSTVSPTSMITITAEPTQPPGLQRLYVPMLVR